MAQVSDEERQWSYHDNPKVIGAIAAVAGLLGIVLALAFNSGGERTTVATVTPPPPVTAPPLVPEPPVGSTVEPKT